jgi:hypothetical protein
MDLERMLRELLARHGLNYEFSKKYTVKNELTTVFSTKKNSYWSVVATIPLTWVTPAEHDALFCKATEVALEKWLEERMTTPIGRTGYWIYPGERRPIIVKAETEEEALEKVRKSPEYDGFGPSVYRVEAFSVLCEHGQAP